MFCCHCHHISPEQGTCWDQPQLTDAHPQPWSQTLSSADCLVTPWDEKFINQGRIQTEAPNLFLYLAAKLMIKAP